MTSVDQVTKAISEFFSRISHCAVPTHYEMGIRESQDKIYAKRADWAQNAGVYLFFKNNELKYVGRALITTGLARRVLNQSTAFGDPKWDDVIKDALSSVHVFELTNDESHWAPSLELFLTQKFRSSLINRRLS